MGNRAQQRATAAAAPAVAPPPPVEELDDVIVDDEATLADEADIIFDPDGIDEIDEVSDFDAAEMTTTDNFMGGSQAAPSNEIVELPVEVADPKTKTYVVRVVEDVGPVYYGERLIELKKGKRYRVDHPVFQYLSSRNMLVG